MVAYESVGMMLGNIGLFGTGIAFSILALVMASVRGITKNSEMWAIGFTALAWLMALIIPNVPWGIIIFVAGSVALTVAFMPLLKKMEDSNIFTIAIISIAINLLLILGSGAYSESLGWQTNIDSIQTDIANLLGDEVTALDGNTPSSGLCRPDDTECSSSAISGAYSSIIYDVFASVLAIGDYISKAVKFAGMVVFAPFAIAKFILPQVANSIVYWLIAILLSMFNLAILYKIIAFILNKRGMT